MKANKLPIDGYVIDESAENIRKPHRCDACGDLTTNIREDIATGYKEDDICDSCLYEYYPNVNW